MKGFLLILICFICVTKSYGQINNSYVLINVEVIKKRGTIVSKMEATGFEAKDSSFIKSIKKNINESIKEIKKIKKGKYTVIAKFILSKDGSLSDISCENDSGVGICNEIIRILRKSKKWTPINH